MVKLFGKEMTRREIEAHVGRMDQVAGIVPSTRADGRAAGLRSLVVSNGAGLSMTCLPDRGLDISHAEYRGVPLCWRSSNGDAAASFYDDDDAEWLRTFFGGLLTTCGLTNFGPAGADQYGSFGLHGRINATPADDVLWSQRWEGDEWILEVEGIARQTRTFGEHLSLARRLQRGHRERETLLALLEQRLQAGAISAVAANSGQLALVDARSRLQLARSASERSMAALAEALSLPLSVVRSMQLDYAELQRPAAIPQDSEARRAALLAHERAHLAGRHPCIGPGAGRCARRDRSAWWPARPSSSPRIAPTG